MHNDKSAIESWSHLWSEPTGDFVLLKVDGSDRGSIEGCLIYNTREHSILLIEDEQLAQRLMENMKAAGVLVAFKDEIPSGENKLERLINEMIEMGRSPKEINAAIEAERSRDAADR